MLACLLGFCLFLSFPHKISANSEITSLFSDREIECLAKNIYFEARGESIQGKLAVAQVTINRMNDYRWPKTICQVVYQPGQFSWTHAKLKITDNKLYLHSRDLAYTILAQPLIDFPYTHFHNTQVQPNWRHNKKTKIGNHIFYQVH